MRGRGDVGALPLACRPGLVWASPPCQGWSSAGKRLGERDPRDGFPALFAALDRLRPTWCVVENVPGLTTRPHRAAFEDRVLAELARRFAVVHWTILNAADFGVPQTRRRVFVVAGPRAVDWPEPTHAREPGGLFDERLPWRTAGEALGLAGRITDGLAGTPNRASAGTDDPSITLTRAGLCVIGGGSNPHGPGRAHERTERDLTHAPSTTITAEQIGNAGPWVIDNGTTSGRRQRPRPTSRPEPTIGTARNTTLARPASTILGGSRDAGRRCNEQFRRRLTPAECALLQAWPEVIPHLASLTKTAAYRVVGNAVPPPVAAAIAKKIIAAS